LGFDHESTCEESEEVRAQDCRRGDHVPGHFEFILLAYDEPLASLYLLFFYWPIVGLFLIFGDSSKLSESGCDLQSEF